MSGSNGARARAWRQSLRLTQAQLAAALDVSIVTIQNMERGHLPGGRPVSPRAWSRYRLMCAGWVATQAAAPHETWPMR